MNGAEKNAEPLFAQVSTAEVKRILSDRFAQDVLSTVWGRLSWTFTFVGVAGVAAVGALFWKALTLDAEVASKISAQKKEILSEVTNGVERDIARVRDGLEGRLTAHVNERVVNAFGSPYGDAVRERLRTAVADKSFQDEVRDTVRGVMGTVWDDQKEALRRSVLEQVVNKKQFLDEIARQVSDAMTQSGAVREMLAESLEGYLRAAHPEDTGRTSALVLLAAMNQVRANGAVSHLLDESAKHGKRAMALQGLRHVSFDRVRLAPGKGDAVKMLGAALVAWSDHCAATECSTDTDSARGIESFFARGRDLREAEDRAAWVSRLAVWHEQMLRQNGRARKASMYLVPRALGAIDAPEARNTLVRWFLSGDTDLTLSAAEAVGNQTAAGMSDAERLLPFKALWPTVARREERRAVLAEAAWMALGRVSRGRADPTGAYRPEAALVLARTPRAAARGPVARWASARPLDVDGQPAPAPPDQPCAIGLEAPSKQRATLCALAALIRPERGPAEWGWLRQEATTAWDEDEVAILGLLWGIACGRAPEGAPGAEARLAPLPDLLRMRPPAPAAWELAAMLLVRTAPEQAAWEKLLLLRPRLDEAPLFVAASGSLFSPWTVAQRSLVDGWRGLPAPVQRAVLREIAAAGAGLPPLDARAEDPLAALVRKLSAPGFAALNALNFAHAATPDAALGAVERENGFRLLQEIEAGAALGGDAQASMAGDLHAALLDHGGWSRAVFAVPPGVEPPLAGPSTPLVPSLENRFGPLRLRGGDTVSLRPARTGKDAGASAPVTFLNWKTKEVRVLGPRESWRLPGFEVEEWMFRLGAAGPAIQLVAVPAETLAPAATPSAADLPTIEMGRVYTVQALPAGAGRDGSAGDLAGWARLPRLRAGDRVRISTFDLAEDVDTVVEVNNGAAEPAQDDNGGGDGLSSRLEWTADEDGEALVRLGNTGAPGAFRFQAERLAAAPAEAFTAPGRAAFLPDRPR